MTSHHNLGRPSRRRFLKGLGGFLALPAFESLMPARAAEAGKLAVSPSGAPLRVGFVYFPNGALQAPWWPSGEGKEFTLNTTMEPLEPVKHQVQVLGGLNHVHAYAGPDGAGDHARASGTFLTGVRVKKTAGADIRAAISIDQLAANHLGHLTRFPSLELSCDAVRKSGSCDSGYSCAYQYNLAWKSANTPIAPETNPRLLFERLFGPGAAGERRANVKARQQEQQSVLDFVLDDAKALNRELGGRDRMKLDEYLGSVREVEKRIAEAERFGEAPDPAVETPAGVPPKFGEYIDVMFDLMLLAFQTDSTRIATFLMANDGSNRTFPDLGFPEGHHYLTHHRNIADMKDKVARIDRFYMSRFAAFLQKLERAKDADGTSVLHNSMIVYGGGIADGNRHTHSNLPLVLAGGGGAGLTPGRYTKFKSQPMSNLFLTMLDRLGVAGVDRFGDSTGRSDGV
jgi:hypothetical protein